MDRGLYIAASGMLAEQTRQDQIANDLANASTPGYKADRSAQAAFGDVLIENTANGQALGTLGLGTQVTRIVTDMNPSPLKQTGESLDLALDFQWLNRQLFYNQYKRIDSFFANTDLQATGLPSAGELALLNPWRAKLDPAVFGPPPKQPDTDPPGSLRANVARLKEEGLIVNISEMDVRVRNLPVAKGDPTSAPAAQAQRDVYFQTLRACLLEPNFSGVTVWGVTDKHTWVREFYKVEDAPLLEGVMFLQGLLREHKSPRQTDPSLFPTALIPKAQRPYLYAEPESDDADDDGKKDDTKQLVIDRYEFLVYKLLRNALEAGVNIMSTQTA